MTTSIPARLSMVTLGVTDLARATAFYQALGWPLSSASADGVSFFHTDGGLLALFGADDLAADAEVAPAPPTSGFRGFSLAINVDSRAEVDAAVQVAVDAGGTVLRAPSEAFWGGYTGYFTDPEGYAWEVAHNPGWPIGSDGRPQLPA